MIRQGSEMVPRKPVRQARQARSRNTVEAIIEAAARILADSGWSALTTNAIARVAGVSVGSVYEYFANKQAIVDVIIDRHLSGGEAHLVRLAAGALEAPSLDDIVRLLVDGFVSVHCDNPKLHKVLSGDVPLSKEQRVRVEQIRSRAISFLSGLLTGRVDRPELKAAMMIDAADALTHRWFIDEAGVPASADEMTRELRHLLRAYIAA